MYKSTLTRACVDYLESTDKTTDEDHARRLDNLFCFCEKFIDEGRRDANAHKVPQTLSDMQERAKKAANDSDNQEKMIQNIAEIMHTYYMLGYDFPNFKEDT